MLRFNFGSEMVSSDTCLSKHCCQQLPGIQSKVTQMMDELIKQIHSMQSGYDRNCTQSPSTTGSPLKMIIEIIHSFYIYITDNRDVFIILG